MAIVIACARCGKQLRAPENLVGKRVQCPGCGGAVLVQARTESVAPPSTIAAATAGIVTPCSCGHRFEAAAHQQSLLVRCPGCNQPVRVPGSAAPIVPSTHPPVAAYAPPPIPAPPVLRDPGPPCPPMACLPPPRPSPNQPSNNLVWIIAGIVGGTLALIALVLVIVAMSGSSIDVEGKVFSGHETLMGFGALQFEFHKGHRVVMVDAGLNDPRPIGVGRRPFPPAQAAARRLEGNWQQHGAKVICNFQDCRYEGTIENQTLSGAARFTQGMQAGQAWMFTVSFQGKRVK